MTESPFAVLLDHLGLSTLTMALMAGVGQASVSAAKAGGVVPARVLSALQRTAAVDTRDLCARQDAWRKARATQLMAEVQTRCAAMAAK